MIRIFIISAVALLSVLTLSQCDNGMKAGAPKNNTVIVKVDTTQQVEEKADTTSSMSPAQVSQATSLISAASDEKIAGIDAKKIYKSHCAICHGMNGALGVNGAKNLTASVISLEEAVAQIYFGKGLMTPFKGTLSDDEIVAVAKYTETLRKK